MKSKIVNNLKQQLQEKLDQAKLNYQSSKSLTTSEDMKSDGKYDTRAIEAGYLASAQKQRLDELEQDLQLLDSIEFHDTKDISIGSLVEMEFNKTKQWYFVSSISGGPLLKIDDQVILIISAFSPLGNAMIGLSKDDEFELQTPKGIREYNVLNIR